MIRQKEKKCDYMSYENNMLIINIIHIISNTKSMTSVCAIAAYTITISFVIWFIKFLVHYFLFIWVLTSFWYSFLLMTDVIRESTYLGIILVKLYVVLNLDAFIYYFWNNVLFFLFWAFFHRVYVLVLYLVHVDHQLVFIY
jgi:hypothetical protein